MKEEKPIAPPDQRVLAMAQYGQVSDFETLMRVFMRGAQQDVPDMPTLSTKEVQVLRVRLIQEELDELAEAYAADDIVAAYDACLDLLYVVVGTGVAHCFNLLAGNVAVHQNNMDKLANGYVDEGGKFIKPKNHPVPDLKALLEMQWRVSVVRADAEANTCNMCEAMNHEHPVDIEPWQYLNVLCDGRRVKL